MCQYVEGKNGKKLLLFYDTGCMGATISDRGYSLLDTTPGTPGPVNLDVAGGQSIRNPYGFEKFMLEKVDDNAVEVTALHMVDVTSELPLWELAQAWNDVATHYAKSGGQHAELPTCPVSVGGEGVDIMLGVEYFHCFPDLVHELPSGLKLYKARVKTGDQHLGILGGPHESWVRAAESAHILGPRVYFISEVRAMNLMSRTLKSYMKFEMHCAPEVMSLQDKSSHI